MRRTMLRLSLVAVLLCAGATASHGQAPVKRTPADAEIIKICGARLATVFARFGVPENVTVSRGSNADLDKVSLDYGSYAVQVRDKTVRTCLFFSSWTGPVRGVRIGDTRQQVEKVLGTDHKVEKSSIDVEDYGYALKDLDAMFWTDFDKEGKVRMVEIQLN